MHETFLIYFQKLTAAAGVLNLSSFPYLEISLSPSRCQVVSGQLIIVQKDTEIVNDKLNSDYEKPISVPCLYYL